MKTISKRIASIFKEYYAKAAEDRFITLLTYSHEFMASLNYESNGYYIDEAKLIKAVDSYFLDVIRYKEYHLNAENIDDVHSKEWLTYIHRDKKINDSKVAALTAKWLLKASPIAVFPKNQSVPVDDDICHVNELFTLNCVLYCLLQYDYDLIDADDYKKLFYDFKYRSFDERAYFSRFELLEKLVIARKKYIHLQDAEDGK